jgi:hypothetical protein
MKKKGVEIWAFDGTLSVCRLQFSSDCPVSKCKICVFPVRFKDCMDDKKATLLQLEHDDDDATGVICNGLKVSNDAAVVVIQLDRKSCQ